jgi:hypothetical protein
MQQQITLKVKPFEAGDTSIIKDYIAKETGKPITSIIGFYKLKH